MSKIEKLLAPYVNLPLECDGLARVLHRVLHEAEIPHKTWTGKISGNGQEILHFWIVLGDGRIVDYRAQMWLGKKGVPNGIFHAADFPQVCYEGEENEIGIPADLLFRILTMERPIFK